MHEIELKFRLDEPAPQIWQRARKLDPALRRPRVRTLRSIYYDTPTQSLREAGIALRMRRDGRRWIQTVKAGRVLSAGYSRAVELENVATDGRLCLDAIPDEAMREAVRRAVGDAPLQPVCETVFKRTSTTVAASADTLAELVVDVGQIQAGQRSEEFREVEVELLRGDPRGLFDMVRVLFPDGGLRLSRLSKSARGYLLARKGYIEPPLAPRCAAKLRLEPTLPAEDAVREALRECAGQVTTNIEVVRELEDPEGPHQLRIGLRRLRSVFDAASPIACGEVDRLDREAQWLAREVGKLRDLDVVGGEIVRKDTDLHPDEPGLRQLARRLVEVAATQRLRLRETLTGSRVQAFVLDLICLIETAGWRDPTNPDQRLRLAGPATAMAREAFARHWKKAGRRGRKIATLDIEQRHRLRKELKKLRYTIDLFHALYEAKPTKDLTRRLRQLQSVFGALNDAAVARTLLDDADVVPAGDAVLQRAAGWVVGATQTRAEARWTGIQAQWREFEKTRRFRG